MHWRLATLLFLVLAPVTAAPARDVILPGNRNFKHQLVIEDGELFRTHQFVAAPVRGFRGVHLVVPGEPFSFSSKYGTRIYAVPIGETIPAELDEAWKAAHVAAEIPVAEVASVPLTSPIDSLVTRLEIAELFGAKLQLAVVSEERTWSSTALWVLGASAVLGLGGLALVVRRRRGAALPT